MKRQPWLVLEPMNLPYTLASFGLKWWRERVKKSNVRKDFQFVDKRRSGRQYRHSFKWFQTRITKKKSIVPHVIIIIWYCLQLLFFLIVFIALWPTNLLTSKEKRIIMFYVLTQKKTWSHYWKNYSVNQNGGPSRVPCPKMMLASQTRRFFILESKYGNMWNEFFGRWH
jgi:hypothetical protein